MLQQLRVNCVPRYIVSDWMSARALRHLSHKHWTDVLQRNIQYLPVIPSSSEARPNWLVKGQKNIEQRVEVKHFLRKQHVVESASATR
jgi:hypothetical protein